MSSGRMKARIYVMPKESVLDPQGQAIAHALGNMGFADIKEVRQGKLFEIEIDQKNPEEAKSTLKQICEKLLANTVIETYRVDIGE